MPIDNKSKRWHFNDMLNVAQKLFTKINKKKRLARHNNDIHFLAREINEWLPSGIQSLIDGTYTPRNLKRIYFKNETVDQLYLPDRIFQHVLLKQLKSTLKHIVNPNCLHIYGPTGVKYATERVRKALQDDNPQFVVRVDIKSFYRSISHFKLIQDIKRIYADPNVQAMLEQIITNTVETSKGYMNDGYGITLRGPLSQLFSAIYLKPLDDKISKMNVTYIRFQDDILILCKTKRQLNRCKRYMQNILNERQLKLSRKKSRIGHIQAGFHFLGIDYFGTQTQDNTKAAHSNDSKLANILDSESYTSGGVDRSLNIY